MVTTDMDSLATGGGRGRVMWWPMEQGRERQPATPAIVPGLAGKDMERVACGDLFHGNDMVYNY